MLSMQSERPPELCLPVNLCRITSKRKRGTGNCWIRFKRVKRRSKKKRRPLSSYKMNGKLLSMSSMSLIECRLLIREGSNAWSSLKPIVTGRFIVRSCSSWCAGGASLPSSDSGTYKTAKRISTTIANTLRNSKMSVLKRYSSITSIVSLKH